MIKAWMKNVFPARQKGGKADKLKATYVCILKRYTPETPMDGYLRLDLVITFPYKAKHKAKKFDNYEYILRNTAPDVDNASKIFIDALEEAGIVHNDSRFCRIVTEKRFGPNPGVQFRISHMHPIKLKQMLRAPFA